MYPQVTQRVRVLGVEVVIKRGAKRHARGRAPQCSSAASGGSTAARISPLWPSWTRCAARGASRTGLLDVFWSAESAFLAHAPTKEPSKCAGRRPATSCTRYSAPRRPRTSCVLCTIQNVARVRSRPLTRKAQDELETRLHVQGHRNTTLRAIFQAGTEAAARGETFFHFGLRTASSDGLSRLTFSPMDVQLPGGEAARYAVVETLAPGEAAGDAARHPPRSSGPHDALLVRSLSSDRYSPSLVTLSTLPTEADGDSEPSDSPTASSTDTDVGGAAAVDGEAPAALWTQVLHQNVSSLAHHGCLPRGRRTTWLCDHIGASNAAAALEAARRSAQWRGVVRIAPRAPAGAHPPPPLAPQRWHEVIVSPAIDPAAPPGSRGASPNTFPTDDKSLLRTPHHITSLTRSCRDRARRPDCCAVTETDVSAAVAGQLALDTLLCSVFPRPVVVRARARHRFLAGRDV